MKSAIIIYSSIILTIISCFFGNINGGAVMSVDLGNEWFKVAIVSPGIPMDIALNKESKRKTPMTSAFRDDERLFGEDAQVVGVRFPKNSFSYILDLVGKSIDNPIVELYRKRFPYYDIIADEERNTIAFKLNEETVFTPEELLAQILHVAREMAVNSAKQPVNEVVLTVPGFFNQAERRALYKAAELADLKVLQLINDYTAVALNYGIFNRKEINDTAHYIMFYDMGASSTTATVVSYQNVKTKDRGIVETSPQVSILGIGYDRTLGGLEVQIKLQNYLASEFDKMKKTSNSVFDNPRAMAKLFKEAGRVKNILSANVDHFAQIEGLLDDQDFKFQVTREKLEEMCSDVFERVTHPIKMALHTSGLSIDIISQVVMVGAATRMPKIQDILTEYVGKNLSKSINADEAAAMGAVYKAAELSTGFKVTKFITKDAVVFPIQVVFDKSTDDKPRQVRRTLFGKMNAYPQKKIITFNKRKEDFTFDVNYADLEYLPPHEIKAIGSLNLSTISLFGVTEALEKHNKEGAESKGIKAHFLMDESGFLNLVNVELVSEKSISADVKDEGTFSKLGSTITQFFSGSDDTESAEKTEEPLKEDIKPVHEEPEQPPELTPEENPKSENETKTDQKPINQTTENKDDKKMTVTVLREPTKSVEVKYGSQELKDEKFEASREKLKTLELRDRERKRRETALNNLESFVINTQQDLKNDEYIKAAAPTEIDKIVEACQKTSDWLYEDGFDATADVYEDKLKELQGKTLELYDRVFEHRERPDALAGMFSMLNASNTFLTNMKTLDDNQIFTQIEIEQLEKTINDTVEYHQTVIRVSADTPLHEPVKYSVRDIANKMAILDREVKYLVNKAKIWKPKVEPTTNQTEKVDQEIKENQTESASDSTTDSEEEQIMLDVANDKISESALPDSPTVNENETDDTLKSSTSDDEHQEL